MRMRHKDFYILLSFLASCFSGFSQVSSTELTRSDIFDRMEARAKSLAKRMGEMSGKESQSAVQNSPSKEISNSSPSIVRPQPRSSGVEAARDNESSNAQNSTIPESRSPKEASVAFSVVDDSEDYLPIESAQELLGDYYISPSLGFVLSSESKVTYKLGSTMEEKDLDNELGYGIGMRAGIRFDNFFTEIGIKYSTLDYNIYGIAPFSGQPYTGEGSVDVLNCNARLGYTFPINNALAFNGSVGLGLSNRKNTFDIYSDMGNIFVSTISSSETVLSYDLAFSITYYVAESYLISLGYNYMNVGKISQFDALNLHYFELGLGLNF